MPFFKEFEIAAQNYLRFFKAFRRVLWVPGDWIKSVEDLNEKRDEFRTQRIKLLASIDALWEQTSTKSKGNKKEEEVNYLIRKFFVAVQKFLTPQAILNPNATRMFPSIAKILDEHREKTPHGVTHSGVVIELFEFLAYQEEHQ